jgi:PTH1 family peptidyl-tRNA hydrolase
VKIVCGLGNPGIRYKNTRHNVGFVVLSKLCEEIKAVSWHETKNYVSWKRNEWVLIFPQTYMNLSGLALQEAAADYNIDMGNILVVLDDVNLPLGKLRIREKGSDGGHKGLRSIITTLERDDFARLRIGIGPAAQDGISCSLEEYVLLPFTEEERNILNKIMPDVIKLIKAFLNSGYQKMADEYSKNVGSLSLSTEEALDEDCNPPREEINNRKETYEEEQNI